MIKYYKEENNRLIEAPINFKDNDGSIICNFNINESKMLEKGYIPLTDQQVREYYYNKEQTPKRNIETYRFSKLKVKEKLVELGMWDSLKESLSENDYEDLLLADDLAFDNEVFTSLYNKLRYEIENIDYLLMECINGDEK